MKIQLLAIALFAGILNNLNAQTDNYQLVWSDEFDGTSLNLGNWSCETGRGYGGWGTGQLDYATDTENNVKVDNGTLKLVLRNDGAPDGNTTNPYTSGRLISYGKQKFLYGKIEARIKGVDTQGLGFAFWTLGDNFKATGYGWPRCGEIDIMENTGKTPSYNIGTLHYSSGGQHAQSQGNFTLSDNQKYADAFHVFGIEWTPDYIQFYIDDNLYYKRFIFNPIDYDPFHKAQFLILSVGVGGSYSGAPDATTLFPMTAEIDWVRVYQKAVASDIDNHSRNEMGAFPNPAKDQIELQLPAEDNHINRIEFINLQGQLVKCLTDNFTSTIDIANLNSGNYIIRIHTASSVYTSKLIKQ